VDAAADETGGPDSFLDQESHASAYDEEEEEEEEDEEALNHLAGSQSDEVGEIFVIGRFRRVPVRKLVLLLERLKKT